MQTTPNPSTVVWIVVPLILVTFTGLWLFVITILSYISGWAALAKRYPYGNDFEGQTWKWQSGTMRGTNFNSCLTIGSSARGLYLGLIAPLRFRNPALLVPWNEIAISRKQRFLMQMVCLELGRELRIPFWIRPGLAETLRSAAGGSWPVESIG
jgi:hypothetical protein